MERMLLVAVLVAVVILIVFLLRLTDRLQARAGENSRTQEESFTALENRMYRLSATNAELLERQSARMDERLMQLHKGLGEMQSLAGGVGELKRILANVKNRGIWGEMQLDNLLRDMLAPGQYAENIAVKPQSAERVEFALKLPGQDEAVWLAIDAKFPQEDYQRLLEARELADTKLAEQALKQLEQRLKGEARAIATKYICPPYTTDFAILYLPLEGLFAEAINLPGLLEELQRKYRVCVAGPSTLAALLNSLQLGFRTLAIQKQTSEVWQLVVALKNDFGLYTESLEKSQRKLLEANNNIETAVARAKIMLKKLEKAEQMQEESKHEE
ncbi:MAG: DNA recombination protein RmuC [Acidaminococcaceae bacterium]